MKRVLIIEDDAVVATIYRNKLAREGYQVEVAVDGENGVQRILESRPDIVVLDLMLPKLSGLDVIRRVRSEAGLEHTPILVFSNTYLASLLQDARKAGATRCLSKATCTAAQLLEVIRELLKSAKSTLPISEAVVPIALALPSTSESSEPADLREHFLVELPATLSSLRTLHRSLAKGESAPVRTGNVLDLHKRVHALAASAAAAELRGLAMIAEAFEALLLECQKADNLNTSTVRTIATTIDFLGLVVNKSLLFMDADASTASILVVDDEPISRRAVRMALEKAKLRSICVADPKSALQIAEENVFDLIVLDVNMPVMNGFEFCTAIRALPGRTRDAAVLFVTGLNDLETRVKSTVSGGTDFIAKPFLYAELALKVLCHLLRRIALPEGKPID